MGKRALSILLLMTMLFSLFAADVSALTETISDGKSKTVTIKIDEKFSIMQTTAGNKLNGYSWIYTTDTGITGPAYCINWGLKNPAANKKLTIAGKYTASPKTVGAFAGGYPQRSLEEFLRINLADHTILAGLTKAEYASATQIAVWAALGQIAVDGTDFTEGRATLAKPTDDIQKIRTYEALWIILYNASFWDRMLNTGMGIRLADNDSQKILDIEHRDGLSGAEKEGMAGIKKETINGAEYYTRQFVVASATSTFKHDYFIELWTDTAPEGTIFAGLDNVPLQTVIWERKTLWKVPTKYRETSMNENGEEYAGNFKICIPVRNTPPEGDIIINATTTATQYNIYLANNTDDKEQSYVIADPTYTGMSCSGELKWKKTISPYGRLIVNKTDGMGRPLPGAIFKLTGADGSVFEGTSNSQGRIIWEKLNPDVQYTLSETQTPLGYIKADDVTVSVLANQTQTVNVKNYSEQYLRIRKIDAQNGSPLIGATFRIEQTDGGYKTDVTTGHSGYIEFKGAELPFGSYKIYELKAPEGYEKDKEVQTFEWKGTSDVTVTFKNTRTPSLVLIKMDKDTHEPLEDAAFAVYKDGKKITDVVTDNAGYARISGLSEGYYELEETAASKGYVLDKTRHGIHIDPYNPATEDDPVLVITNERKPGLIIEKLDAETLKPMKGTTFAVYKDIKLIGEYKTNADGLENGWYTIVDKKAARGYQLDSEPHDVEVKDGKITRVTLTNRKASSFLIHKVDASTGKGIYGVTFLVSDRYGNPVAQYTSDQNGYVYMNDKPLNDGKYYIREIAVPKGYVIDNEVKTFYVGYGATSSITWYNTPTQAQIQIVKKSADDNQINGLAAGSLLEGATFEIYDRGGNVVDTVQTDKNGRASSKTLPPGLYTLRETKAPAYYSINETVMAANLEFSG